MVRPANQRQTRLGNLQTKDEAAAIRRLRTVKSHPLTSPAVGLEAEVDDFIAYKRSKGRYTKNSGDTKVLILKAFARWLSTNISFAKVTLEQCEAFYQAVQRPGFNTGNRRKLKNPAKPAGEVTANSYMMTLRAFFRWAVDVRRARFDNPVERLELPRVEHKARNEFCDKDTKNALLAAVPNDDMCFILYCGFDAGLRRDEICEARRDWFDLTNGSLQVRNALTKDRLRPGERKFRVKNGKRRHLPLTRPFQAFLQKYLAGLEPLDFALKPKVKHGKNRYRYDFRRLFDNYVYTQNLPQVKPHVMRHSFASNLKIAGKSIAKIADWIGDTERVTERNYAHLRPDDEDIHALT